MNHNDLRSIAAAASLVLVVACGSTRAVTTVASTTAPATATTLSSTTVAATTPSSTTVAPTTTASVTAAPAPAGRPWFAALRADGTLEAWAKDGKRIAVPTCAVAKPDATDPTSAGCSIADVAVTSTSLWYLLRVEATGTTVMRVPLGGGTPAAVAGASTVPAESFQQLAVSADGETVWVTHASHGDRPVLLERVRGGSTATVATGVTGLATSPDGHRLAYAQFGPGVGTSGPTALVVVDLASGSTRALPLAPTDGAPPYSLVDLAWAPDNRHLSFASSWEGQAVQAVDVDAARTATEAITPQVPIDNPAWPDITSSSAQQACWTGPTTIALGTWRYPYADESPLKGDVVAFDVVTRSVGPAGASVFGQGYGNGMACRSDGAVALVDALPTSNTWVAAPGELVVVRADGTRTVLGKDYQRVFAV